MKVDRSSDYMHTPIAFMRATTIPRCGRH